MKTDDQIHQARINRSNLFLLIGLELFILIAILWAGKIPAGVIVIGIIALTVLVYRLQNRIAPSSLEDPHTLKQKTYTGSETTRIRTLDKQKFYGLIQQIYTHYGFETQAQNNIIQARNGKNLTLIEAVRRVDPSDWPDVATLAKMMNQSKASKGVLICTGGFTAAARILAQKENIQLIELDELMRMIDHIQSVKEVRIL